MFGLSDLAVKDGDVLWSGFKVIDESVDFLYGLITFLRGDEIFDDSVPILLDVLSCGGDLFGDLCLHIGD